jgi:hypothetical protein
VPVSPARASTFAQASVLGGRDIDRHRDTEVRSASPSLVDNALGVPIAPGLYQVFSILLNPIISSALMTFSSVWFIANALRLRRATL